MNRKAIVGSLIRILFLVSVVFQGHAGIAQNMTAAQQYAINRAAVVMVRTEVSASVYVRQLNINNTSFNRLLDSIQSLEGDSIFLSPSQKLTIVLQAINTRSSYYFSSTLNYYRHQQKVSASGTGFVFSREGYIFTNCHVVNENDDYIRRRFILSAFNYVTETNISAIESAWAVKFNDEQRSLLYNTFADVYSTLVPIVLENLRKEIYVFLASEDDSPGSQITALPARIIEKGQSMPGKDVAILKVEGYHDFPSMPLSSDSQWVGEDVFVYGYPDPVTNNAYLSKETTLEPTLTKGIVSAWKKTITGWPVLQMDAIINHGNSGGPVCNNRGEVIGITTFGSLDDFSRSLAPGLNFAVPMLVLQEFLDRSQIVPVQSRLSEFMKRAVLHTEKSEYRKALQYYREVKKLDTSYPGIRASIRYCEQNIQQGKSNDSNLVGFFLLGISLFLAIAFYLFAKRR